MKAVFRVDSSSKIGSGHVMRCMALAELLTETGATCVFVSRELKGNLIPLIEKNGYQVLRLSAPASQTAAKAGSGHQDWLEVDWATDAKETKNLLAENGLKPDWLVVDHYAIEKDWEASVRSSVGKILVIDDLADRPHDCDILLDQCATDLKRYASLIPASARQLLGPRYALLRSEFQKNRQPSTAKKSDAFRVMLFFGASDPTNETERALKALSRIKDSKFKIDLVVGAANPNKTRVLSLAQTMPNVTTHEWVPSISALMRESNLFLGSGGVTTWERCCMGLPSVVIAVAQNQVEQSATLAREGVIAYLGTSEETSEDAIYQAVASLWTNPQALQAYREKCGNVVDGLGTSRVARTMMAPELSLRAAQITDMWKLYEWRNAEENRTQSFETETISRETHQTWFERVLKDSARALLIGQVEGKDVGTLRYDFSGNTAHVSIYLAPGLGGRGLGTEILRAGTKWVATNHPEVEKLIAEIRPSNTASRMAFSKAGYTEANSVFIKEVR
jgi:UDP-2,4-diacetamido-2,4,6-trideoxy-beta-L-altropyranose hydrolase